MQAEHLNHECNMFLTLSNMANYLMIYSSRCLVINPIRRVQRPNGPAKKIGGKIRVILYPPTVEVETEERAIKLATSLEQKKNSGER